MRFVVRHQLCSIINSLAYVHNSVSGWPVNKQNGLRAEWVQEQKNINFYKLIGKLIIRNVNNTKATNFYTKATILCID